MSMHQEHADHRYWTQALRQAVHAEEDFQAGKKPKDNNFSGSISNGKRKDHKPITAKPTKKPKYTFKETRVYQARKKLDKVEKGKAEPRQKIRPRVWPDAHTGIHQKVVEEQKAKGQGIRSTITQHGWQHCQKEISVNTIHRKSFTLPGGTSNRQSKYAEVHSAAHLL